MSNPPNSSSSEVPTIPLQVTHIHHRDEAIARSTLMFKATAVATSHDGKLVVLADGSQVFVYLTSDQAEGPHEIVSTGMHQVSHLEFASRHTSTGGYVMACCGEKVGVVYLAGDGRGSWCPGMKEEVFERMSASFARQMVAQLPPGTLPAGVVPALAQDIKDILQRYVAGLPRRESSLLPGNHAAFSPDGKYLICRATSFGPGEESITIWDVDCGRVLKPRALRSGIKWTAPTSDSTRVAALTLNGGLYFWNIKQGAWLEYTPLSPRNVAQGAFLDAALSPDGTKIGIKQTGPLMSPPDRIHVFDCRTGVMLFSWTDNIGLGPIIWSPKEDVIVTGGKPSELRIMGPGIVPTRLGWGCWTLQPVQFIDQGDRLVYSSAEGTSEIYDFTSRVRHQFILDATGGNRTVVSSDGSLMVVLLGSNVMTSWDLSRFK